MPKEQKAARIRLTMEKIKKLPPRMLAKLEGAIEFAEAQNERERKKPA
ncbi:MAG: hypothetical protein VB099_16505 [Candidatus Limiplasma sp.]|nr:hypothetical protein [Candidatus Limiplasma sp.]